MTLIDIIVNTRRTFMRICIFLNSFYDRDDKLQETDNISLLITLV